MKPGLGVSVTVSSQRVCQRVLPLPPAAFGPCSELIADHTPNTVLWSHLNTVTGPERPERTRSYRYREGVKTSDHLHSMPKSGAWLWNTAVQIVPFIQITFTFMHLADAFIQSDLHCIQVTVSTFYQLLLSLGIEPMIWDYRRVLL